MADMFLKLEGIDGESTDDTHKNEIECLSYSFGVSQAVTGQPSASGGRTHGRADFQHMTCVKELDASSAILALACAEGRHVKEVLLTLHRAGSDKQKFMEYKLEDAIISNVSTSGGGGGPPTETLSMAYGKISLTYTKQKSSDGSPGGNVVAGWDLEANKKL